MTALCYRAWDGCNSNPSWILCRCPLSGKSSQRLNKCFPAVPGPAPHCGLQPSQISWMAMAAAQLEGSLQLPQLGFGGWHGVSSGDTGEGGTKEDVKPSATGWRVGWSRALAG